MSALSDPSLIIFALPVIVSAYERTVRKQEVTDLSAAFPKNIRASKSERVMSHVSYILLLLYPVHSSPINCIEGPSICC